MLPPISPPSAYPHSTGKTQVLSFLVSCVGLFNYCLPTLRLTALEPGALGRFLGLLLGIIYAAFSMCGMEIITLSVFLSLAIALVFDQSIVQRCCGNT